MDNLAGAVTNEGTTLKIFADTIAKLTETNATLAASTKNNTSSTTASSSSTTSNFTVKQLQSAIRNKWSIGAYCSSHGYGVHKDHDSKTCPKKESGHNDSATRAKPGPCMNNKGWDRGINRDSNSTSDGYRGGYRGDRSRRK